MYEWEIYKQLAAVGCKQTEGKKTHKEGLNKVYLSYKIDNK